MTTIDPNILDVAAVVLGEELINLHGWQRIDAIAAMTALGYSKTHIAWALRTSVDTINNCGYRNGIALHTYDQHLDWTAIDMVVTGVARIHLLGADRDEAVRLMARRLTSHEIAKRLRLGEAKEARKIARRLGLTLIEPESWSWEAYRNTGRSNATRQAVAA